MYFKEIIENESPFNQYVSVYPKWVYATMVPDKVNMFFKDVPFFLNEDVKKVYRGMLDKRILTPFSCLLQVHFHNTDEAEEFIAAANRIGLYIKREYTESLPERTF